MSFPYDEPTPSDQQAARAAALRRLGMTPDPQPSPLADQPQQAPPMPQQQPQIQGDPRRGAQLLAMLSGSKTLAGLGQQAAFGIPEQQMQLEAQQREAQAATSPATGAAYRALIGKYGMNAPEGTPNPALEKIAGIAEKGYTAEQQKEARLEAARIMAEARVRAAGMGPPPAQTPDQQANPNALEYVPPAGPVAKQYKAMEDSFKKDMDAIRASPRSAFGQSANIIFRGARLLPLLTQKNEDGSPKMPTTQEWQDIGAGLVAMQTGGVPPEQMTLGLIPKDFAGDASSIMQWLTASPHAPDRQAWVERFTQNIAREEQQAKLLQRQAQLQALPSHSDFITSYPNRAKQAAKAYKIDPSLIDQVRSGTFDPEAVPQATGKKVYNPKTGKVEVQ